MAASKRVPRGKRAFKKPVTNTDSDGNNISQCIFGRYLTMETIRKVMCDPSSTWLVACLLVAAEVCINTLVIWKINYTEIDWRAYMQEVEGVLNGTYDYTKLRGDTGPLVYPAGFVYVYAALYFVTDRGRNVFVGQCIFAAFYIVTLVSVLRIYNRSKKVPPYALVFMCCTSYRIHSIYVLRLFNDPVAMLLLYLSINCFLSRKWTLGCALYSFAVSIKMNIMLFAPGLLVVLLASQGLLKTFWNLALCAIIQVVLALPFLLVNPVGYVSRAFDLGRVFLYEWTVNWRFIPEDVFLNPVFHASLLAAHLLFLIFFAIRHWSSYVKLCFDGQAKMVVLSANAPLLMPLFTSNLIGVAFSRSLHYQFYVWYFHSLPYLLWSTSLPPLLKISFLGVIEMAWNTFPSTVWSSGALQICHICLLVGTWLNVTTPQVLKGGKLT